MNATIQPVRLLVHPVTDYVVRLAHTAEEIQAAQDAPRSALPERYSNSFSCGASA